MYGNIFCSMSLEQWASSRGLGNSTEGLIFFFFFLWDSGQYKQIKRLLIFWVIFIWDQTVWICIVHIYQLGLLSLLEVVSWSASFDSLSASIVLKMATFSSDIWLVPKDSCIFWIHGASHSQEHTQCPGETDQDGAFVNPKYARVHLQIY